MRKLISKGAKKKMSQAFLGIKHKPEAKALMRIARSKKSLYLY